jgi:hypothetical protein
VVALLAAAQSGRLHWLPTAPGWLTLLALLAVYFGAVAFGLRLQRRLASELPASLQLTVDSEYLALQTETAYMRWPWTSVVGCDTVHDMLVITLQGLLTIAIPLRAFDSAAAAKQFADQVRSRLIHPRVATSTHLGQPAPTQSPGRPAGALLQQLAHNLYAGTLLLFLRRSAFQHLRSSSAQFALLVGLDVVGSVLLQVLASNGQGFLNWYALPDSLFFILSFLAAACLAAWLAGRPERTLGIAVAIAALGLPASLLVQVSYLFVDVAVRYWLWWAFIGWTSIASAVAAVRMLDVPALRAAYIGPAVLAALILPPFFDNVSNQLWVPKSATATDYRTQYERVGSEAVLYSQPRLLDEALRAVEAGKPGVVELFYVGFAGSAYQDVFLNEVTGAEQILKERFALGSRSIILANSMRTPEERPFATATALRRALDAVAQKMNRDEDVLLLFLTAHGAANHQLDVQMYPFRFQPLAAAELRAMLDATGIRNRVIVVSACYSGGFIPPNQDPHTLIITAAHADKTSFGCRDGAQWTYFGQAFFSEALSQTRSFEDAFHLASERIREREQTEKLDPSDPQMFAGALIGAPLQALYQTLPSEPTKP